LATNLLFHSVVQHAWSISVSDVKSASSIILISSCHERILLLFTYAKIEYVSVRTYVSKMEYVRYVYSSLDWKFGVAGI